jgi:chloramphenicol-sensitive protein RarD
VFVALLCSSALLSCNWIIYIWAVNAGFVVETSLGYFINPLLNVFLGMAFLGERLRRGQYAALLIALAGVLYLTVSYGKPPWIALSLALTFGFYGLVRKTAPIPSLEGLAIETMILFLPAICFLLYLEQNHSAAFYHQGLSISVLLAGAGIVTTIPLFLFGYAARLISLTSLGLLQYLAPTLQLLIGIFLYQEGFPKQKAVGFSLVWIALLFYSTEGILFRRYRRRSLGLKQC